MDSGALAVSLLILGIAVALPLVVLGVFKVLERRLAKATASSTTYRKATVSGNRPAAFSDEEKVVFDRDAGSAEKQAALAFVLSIVGAALAPAVIGLVPLLMALVLGRSSTNTLLNYNRPPSSAARHASMIAWIGLILFTAACIVGIPVASFAWMASAGTEALNRGKERVGIGDHAGAIVDLTESIGKNSRSPEAYAYRALSYVESGQADAALKDAEKAVQLDRGLGMAYYSRARAFAALQQNESALIDAHDAIRLDPAHSDSYILRGILYSAQGDAARAAADFTHAIKLAPQNHRAYYQRGRHYADQGRHREAVSDLENVVKLTLPQWPIHVSAKELLAKLRKR
jgi:tetratricopeptide (TPR) repeat protein